jgi:hypothetical protein
MLLNNNTILLPNLDSLQELLNNNSNENNYMCHGFYEDKIAVRHQVDEYGKNSIRIWKTTCLFGVWYNDFNSSQKNFIAALDYNIYENSIKIEYLNINDFDKNYMFLNPLDEDESINLVKSLINFIKIVATKENKPSIILDVHENLRLFFKYYNDEGFRITNRKCKTNPFWLESEIIIENKNF